MEIPKDPHWGCTPLPSTSASRGDPRKDRDMQNLQSTVSRSLRIKFKAPRGAQSHVDQISRVSVLKRLVTLENPPGKAGASHPRKLNTPPHIQYYPHAHKV